MSKRSQTSKENPLLLEARGLEKRYRIGSDVLPVLRGVDLSVRQGQWICILGSSGSGKSTLLHLLGGLDRPDRGEVFFRGDSLNDWSTAQRDQFRQMQVGFVFQFYHLLPELSVLENTLVRSMIGTSWWQWWAKRRQLRSQAEQLLDELGLADRLAHLPNELSGGERQRVALARALMTQPEVLLADEPTGNLDQKTGERILELIAQRHRQGQTIVMVTHDLKVAERADVVLTLQSGQMAPPSSK